MIAGGVEQGMLLWVPVFRVEYFFLIIHQVELCGSYGPGNMPVAVRSNKSGLMGLRRQYIQVDRLIFPGRAVRLVNTVLTNLDRFVLPILELRKPEGAVLWKSFRIIDRKMVFVQFHFFQLDIIGDPENIIAWVCVHICCVCELFTGI